MIRIEQPYYFIALLAIPVVIWIYIVYRSRKKKSLQKFGEQSVVGQLLQGKSRVRPLLKLVVVLLSLTLIIISLVNPESSNAKRAVHHEGIDVAIVLDVSNSMLAEDEKPSRLEVARQFATQLVEQLPDERIALITFAATPVLQAPLTIDHST